MTEVLIFYNRKGNSDRLKALLRRQIIGRGFIRVSFYQTFFPNDKKAGMNPRPTVILAVINRRCGFIERFLCIYRSSYSLCLIFKQLDFPSWHF